MMAIAYKTGENGKDQSPSQNVDRQVFYKHDVGQNYWCIIKNMTLRIHPKTVAVKYKCTFNLAILSTNSCEVIYQYV